MELCRWQECSGAQAPALHGTHGGLGGSSLPPRLSGIQFQVSDVFLDPGLFGVSADLPVSLSQENDTWLGAKAAGFKIVNDELAWNLPAVGEAAGSRGVSSICRGRKSSLSRVGHLKQLKRRGRCLGWELEG